MVDTIAVLPALWRQRDADNGEDHTEFDKGCEQTYDECADALERALAAPSAGEPVAWGVEAQGIIGFVAVHRCEDEAARHAAGWKGGRAIPLYTAQPTREAVAGDARDAARWLWARNGATQQDWQQMAARCTTGLALDRYADAAIDAALTGAQP